jgi:hypothetical protein
MLAFVCAMLVQVRVSCSANVRSSACASLAVYEICDAQVLEVVGATSCNIMKYVHMLTASPRTSCCAQCYTCPVTE